MRTEQDKINRKEANQRYYKLEENKEQKRKYMKSYSQQDHVKTKAHQKYMKKKLHIYPHHEEWAKENGYRDNDQLNSKNTIGFKDGAER